MFDPMITAIAGWSAAVEVRARRFLAYEVGRPMHGPPVTMARLLGRNEREALDAARSYMIVPPGTAIETVSRVVSRFRIDGEACPDPVAVARAALAHAGRAVDDHDIHPERRLLATALATLFRVRDRRG